MSGQGLSSMNAEWEGEKIRDQVMYCIEFDTVSHAKQIIDKYKVNINKPDSDGRLFLNVAVHYNNIPMVTYLLKKGANPDLKDASGRTAREEDKTPEMAKVFHEVVKESESKESSPSAASPSI